MAEKCQDCRERVVCQADRCGPCWRLRAVEMEARAAALDDRLHAVLTAKFGPGYTLC